MLRRATAEGHEKVVSPERRQASKILGLLPLKVLLRLDMEMIVSVMHSMQRALAFLSCLHIKQNCRNVRFP